MYYSETLEGRRPLVIATAEQLNREKVLHKVQRLARQTLLWAAERPSIQYAVACEDRAVRTKVSTLVLGKYITAQELDDAGGWLPGLHFTPEEGVYYQSIMTGSTTGLVDTHAENYAGILRARDDALIYDAVSVLKDPQNPRLVPMLDLAINREEY